MSVPQNLVVPDPLESTGGVIGWDPVPEATATTTYPLLVRNADGNWHVVSDTTDTVWVTQNLPLGLNEFKVRACEGRSCSGFSAIVAVTVEDVGVTPLPAPGNLSVPNPIANGDTVTWSLVDGADEYRLQISSGQGDVSVVSLTNPEWVVSGLSADSYTFEVQACATSECSVFSDAVATVFEGEELDPLTPPQNLVVPDPLLSEGGEISWDFVHADSTYTVIVRDSESNWHTVIRNTSDTSWVTTGLVLGSNDFRVRSCLGTTSSCGANSDSVTVTVVDAVQDPIPTPENLTVPNPIQRDNLISWSPVADIDHYLLEQQFEGGLIEEINTGLNAFYSFQETVSGEYTYRVKACSFQSCSDYSPAQTVTFLGESGIPFDSALIPTPYFYETDYSVGMPGGRVAWFKVNGATSYKLYRHDGVQWVSVQEVKDNFWAAHALVPGSHSFAVQACLEGECGPAGYSESIEFFDTPSIPVGLVFQPNEDNFGGGFVEWAPVEGADYYQLQARKEGGDWGLVFAHSLDFWIATYPLFGNYEFRVSACNMAGCSDYSTPINGQIEFEFPSGFSVPNPLLPAGGIISWDPMTGATFYVLSMKGADGTWVDIYDGLNPSWITNSSVIQAGGNYEFKVRACSVDGCGPYSDSVAVTVQEIPSPPSGLTAASPLGAPGGLISWNNDNEVAEYRLYGRLITGEWSQIYRGESSNWVTSDLPAGIYEFEVLACTAGGVCSLPSDSIEVDVTPALLAPTSLNVPSVIVNPGSVISWTGSLYGDEVYVLSGRPSGGIFSEFYRGVGTEWVASLPNDRPMSFRVEVCNSQVCSARLESDQLLVVDPLAPPTMASVADFLPSSGALIAWQGDSATMSSYELYYSFNQNDWELAYDGEKEEFVMHGFENQTVFLAVKGCDENQCSSLSNAVETTFLPPVEAPASISVSIPFLPGYSSVNWSSVPGAGHYNLIILFNGEQLGEPQTILSGQLSWQMSSAEDGFYQFGLQACNELLCSGYAYSSVTEVASTLDTDNDGFSDEQEVANGTDPENVEDFPEYELIDFSSNKSEINFLGESVTLSWQVNGALAVELQVGESGQRYSGLPTNGTFELTPTGAVDIALVAITPAEQKSTYIHIGADIPPPTALWQSPAALDLIESRVSASLTIAPSGNSYIGDLDNNYYGISANGMVDWVAEGLGRVNRKGRIINEDIIVAANTTSVSGATSPGILYRLDNSGQVLWQYPQAGVTISGEFVARPVVSEDRSTVYAINYLGDLFAVNANDGSCLWMSSLFNPGSQRVLADPVWDSSSGLLLVQATEIGSGLREIVGAQVASGGACPGISGPVGNESSANGQVKWRTKMKKAVGQSSNN